MNLGFHAENSEFDNRSEMYTYFTKIEVPLKKVMKHSIDVSQEFYSSSIVGPNILTIGLSKRTDNNTHGTLEALDYMLRKVSTIGTVLRDTGVQL